jgi:hypothetical protein
MARKRVTHRDAVGDRIPVTHRRELAAVKDTRPEHLMATSTVHVWLLGKLQPQGWGYTAAEKGSTFSVATQSQRGTCPAAETQWRGELYRLHISSHQLQGNDITRGFNALGFPCSQKCEVQASFGVSGKEANQEGAATLDSPSCKIGVWTGALPKTKGGTDVYCLLKRPTKASTTSEE